MKPSCLNNEILFSLFTVPWKLYLEYCAYFLAKQLQKGTTEGVAKKEVKISQIKGTETLIYKK